MSRHDLLERILEARFEFEYAPRETKAACKKHLDDLISQAIAGTDVSPHELMITIFDRYLEYKKKRRQREIVSLSQRLRTP